MGRTTNYWLNQVTEDQRATNSPHHLSAPLLFLIYSVSSGGGMSARRRRERPMTMKHAVTVCGGSYKRRRERPAREQRTRSGGYEHGAATAA